MKTSKKNHSEHYQSAPAIQTAASPPAPEQIRQRAHEIYLARGGEEGRALNDWLMAEKEVKKNVQQLIPTQTVQDAPERA